MSTDLRRPAPAASLEDSQEPATGRIRARRARHLRAELAAGDREIRELRAQLRAIHTSGAWAILRTLTQLRHALAPHGTWRDRLARSAIRGLRRLKKRAIGLSRTVATARVPLGGSWHYRPIVEPAATQNYEIICLPMIEWHDRFQRPQQLMRQFARASHPVLYAANRFHGGAEAHLQPIETNVLEVILPGDRSANIYHDLLGESHCARMLAAIERLASARRISDGVVVAQHPFWTPLAEVIRNRFGWRLIYDCMDDHSGFWDNAPEVLRVERRLIATADLVVASSRRLHDGIRARSRSAVLVRNGCDYEHFARVSDRRPSRPERPTIGYYGAIAAWFDAGLVARLAALRPGWRFELIGSTLGGDVRPLDVLANVRLLGECPYSELPGRIDGWDAFIIPFQRLPLTEATNPVKVYEMLATGRPVIAVGLPELRPIARKGLIRLAATAEQFAAAIEAALEDGDSQAAARRAFARRNTWSARHRTLAAAIESIRRGPGA